MGNRKSRPTAAAPSFVTIRSVPDHASANVEAKQVKKILQQLQIVIDDMKAKMQANPLILSMTFDPLFATLESLNEIMEPERPQVCYMVGPSDAGKSSTINGVCREKICHVGETDIPGTTDFQVIPAPEVNAIFVDTIGFGSNPKGDRDLLNEMQNQVKLGHRPDVIVLMVTKSILRTEGNLAIMIKDFNTYLKWVNKQRSNVQVPVFCVLGKIDEYFNGELPNTEAALKQVNECTIRALATVNKYLMYPASRCIPISAKHDYGIEDLRNNINAHSPLNAQIIERTLDYVSRARPSIANKIIVTFSAASAAASFLPLANILILNFLQSWMCRMLACFSIDPERTPETFEELYRAQEGISIHLRQAALVAGGALQLSVYGYLLGSSICIATAFTTTGAMGRKCYRYFTN